MTGHASGAVNGLPGRRGTGLRNRNRNGKHSYKVRNKASRRDRYGEFVNGRQQTPDVIAGRQMSY